MTNGTARCADALDLEHSQLILLWATNTRLTNRHLWPTIERARERGARVVVVDPIRTLTAEGADEHVQPLPGTDVALLNGLLHVIVEERLYDAEFVRDRTEGFENLRRRITDFTPEALAPVCGIAPETIVGIAYDSGGVTTSTLTVPLVTALGVGLAQVIRGRNPLIDGFGLIALASLTPMIFVLVFGMVI